MKLAFRTLFVTLFAILPFLGCAWGGRPYSNTEISVDFSKAGAAYEIDFQIYREQRYNLVALWYTHHRSHNNEVVKYLHGVFTDNGKLRRGIPIHILITRLSSSSRDIVVDSNKVIFDIFAVGGREAPIYSSIASFNLRPGKYRMKITNIKGHHHLKFVPAKIKLLRLYA